MTALKRFSILFSFVFMTFALGIPLLSLLGEATQVHWSAFFLPSVLATVRFTLEQGFWSLFLSLFFGIPFGFWIAGRRGPQVLALLPMAVPSVVAGLAWVLILGKNGVLGDLDWGYSFQALVLAHVFFNVPWIGYWVSKSIDRVPRSQIESARSLGASFFQLLIWVYWPYLKWNLGSASAQVLNFCWTSFALVFLLGGGPPVQTLETALFSRLRWGGLDVAGALPIAAWQLILGILPWIFLLYCRNRQSKEVQTFQFFQERRPSIGAFLLSAFFLLPYFISWIGIRFQDPSFFVALRVSLELAFGVGVLTLWVTICGLLALHVLKGKLRWLLSLTFILPSGVSILVLGLGFLMAYSSWIDPFEGQGGVIVLLQTVLFLPLSFRSLWGIAQSFQRSHYEAALGMGASPFRAFLAVEWPRWRSPLLATFGVVAAGALGEVAVVSLFYHEDWISLPLLLTRWMGQYRFEEAQSLAGVLLFLALSLILFTQLIGEGLKKTSLEKTRV